MKLAKYLADYIEKVLIDNNDDTWEEVIQQGIEAFVSIEKGSVDVWLRDGAGKLTLAETYQ